MPSARIAPERGQETRGPRVISRGFRLRFSLGNQHRDLTNALAMAQDLSVPVPAGAVAHEAYQAARGRAMYSCVATVVEAPAGVTVGSKRCHEDNAITGGTAK